MVNRSDLSLAGMIILCLFLFCLSFFLYLKTLCPTVDFIDCGELITVLHELGVAHPSGYPFYTLIGNVFLKFLFFVDSPAIRTNLISALFASFSVVSVFLTTFYILSNNITQKHCLKKNLKKFSELNSHDRFNTISDLAGGLFAAIVLSTSLTMWKSAVSAEVYSLSCFQFIFLAFLLFLCISEKDDKSDTGKIILIILYSFGLSLCNHMMVIAIFPGIFYLFFRIKSRLSEGGRLRFFSFCGFFLVVPFSLYLYLPLRAHNLPLWNWGNTVDSFHFYYHVTVKQYRVWMFSRPFNEIIRFLGNSLENILSYDLGLFSTIFCAAGILTSLVYLREIALLLLAILGFNLFYTINYDIPDISSYFLPGIVIFSIFGGLGFSLTLKYIYKHLCGFKYSSKSKSSQVLKILKKILIPLFTLVLIITFTLCIKNNYSRADLSNFFYAEDFALNILNSVENNALILTNLWDFYSPAIYFQTVSRVKPGIAIIDIELLRRTWYFDHIKQRIPFVSQNSAAEIKKYLSMLKLFERDKFTSQNQHQEIQADYVMMIRSFIEKNVLSRGVYSTFLDREMFEGFKIVPFGVIFKIQMPGFQYKDVDNPGIFRNYTLRGIKNQHLYMDERTKFICSRYSLSALEAGKYYYSIGEKTEASELLKFAAELNPLLVQSLESMKK